MGFFASSGDVRREAELLYEIPDLGIVKSFIYAEPLGMNPCWARTVNHHAFDGLSRHLEVVSVRSIDDEAERNSVSVREQVPLGAALRAIGGIGSSFLATERGLRDRTIHCEPVPLYADKLVVRQQSSTPELGEN